jgi:hypothetical protein
MRFLKNTVKNGDHEAEETTDPHAEQGTPTMVVQRSSINIRPLQRYSPSLFYILLIDGGEPETYDEALKVENSTKWELAMKDEIDSLMTNQTWELTELLVGEKALHTKWVYKIKGGNGGNKRYKARLVVKGFQQKESIDYTYFP